MLTISFIILSWNSENYLRKCFQSVITKCEDEKLVYEIIIIDNGSNDGSLDIIEQFQNEYADKFVLIQLETNMGTTRSRNLGLKKARGKYICILDSDTELGEGCLAEILDRLDAQKKIGIIAPKLLLPDGAVQHSVKQFPTLINKLKKAICILSGAKTRNDDFYADFPFSAERQADSAISACWFFRREILDDVGYLDEKIFYAPEDVDYSLRVWKQGYVIIYYPNFVILHHTQQISHKKPLSKMSISHFGGLIYYFVKHGGWFIRPKFD